MIEVAQENDFAKIWIENGIMFCVFKAKEIGINEAKACINFRVSIANGKSYPTIINMSHLKSMDKEARDYFSTKEGSKAISISALIIKSHISKFIGNFFLGNKKFDIPIKLFTNDDEALKWVKTKMAEGK